MSLLSTINGFDLMLAIIITGLIIWNVLLRQESESYVLQIMQQQKEIEKLEWDLFNSVNPPF